MGEVALPRIWVDPDKIEVRSTAIGALPVVNAVLKRLGLDELLGDYLPEPDSRCAIVPATMIGVVVANLCVARRPLYALCSWARGYEPSLLGLCGDDVARVNDDRVGRALDQLFAADRASLLTAISLRMIRRFGVEVKELHNDSTSITLFGAYRCATGQERAGVRPPAAERGFSKDHRGDLKQLVEILTISADGAVPVAHRLADGSVEDSTTHVCTWDQLVSMLGTTDFVYTADCKLATRDNMDHIAGSGGRFLTILPKTRREDEAGRAWIAAGEVAWEEIARRPGKRKDDPDQVYWAAEAPSPSQEGYRIVWIRSSDKRADDAARRFSRIEEARRRLAELSASLSSSRSRIKTRASLDDALAAILKETGAARFLHPVVADDVTYEHRQDKRGRPGKDTRYRRVAHHRFSVTYEVDQGVVAVDSACDGCFPFITNDTRPAAELLRIYKFQPHIERRHATFKGVIEAAPLTLKSDARIDALGFCLYVALLVHALIERELRRAMAAKGIASLPLYYEDRACPAPTAARVFELLEPLSATGVYCAGELLIFLPPKPDPLQRQILSLLKVPLGAYEPG